MCWLIEPGPTLPGRGWKGGPETTPGLVVSFTALILVARWLGVEILQILHILVGFKEPLSGLDVQLKKSKSSTNKLILFSVIFCKARTRFY